MIKIEHHKVFNIRAHILLCIIWMIFQIFGMEVQISWLEPQTACGVVGGIRLALVQGKTGGKVDLVVEEMYAKQARLFSLLDLGKFMGK